MEEASTDLNKEYLLIKNEIDRNIVDIRTKILQCNPLQLLHYAFTQRNSISILSSMTWEKDNGSTFSSIGDAEDLDDIAIQRLPEYIQSVLASSTPLPSISNINYESLFQEISSDFYHIMELIFRFYYIWSMNLENLNPDLTFDERKFLVETQLLYLVRGKRHQIHEIEYLKELLLPHEDIFQILFKMSVDDITEGIKNLEYSLSQGGIESFKEIIDIFARMGFTLYQGPEIDDDEHVFTMLNFAADHPARDMQDTFFIEHSHSLDVTKNVLLRSHTSNDEAHYMSTHQPPIRVLCPGRVYRNEAISARAHCFFHQVEGLYVDKNVSFTDLKQVLLTFAREMFGADTKIRLRPSYFPFTEPSAEMDISCNICGGEGCGFCKHTGWVEILGCGMVDPHGLWYRLECVHRICFWYGCRTHYQS